MIKSTLPELLSPAGSAACLEAAVSAGADAVYLAGKQFGARAYAPNFDDDELKAVSEKLHLRSKKLYVTINTALTDRETDSALNFARFLYENGICDGVIIQDLGLIALIKKELPALTLHGSTQMCVHSAAGVELCGSLGLERVVIARESTKEEIEKCVKTGVEIEIFVHGAHCVSQSGGCLMSSMIGKRSGNRGQCAQPCRLPYEGGYHLSMKDMCLAEHVPFFIDAGVASLKIEGRMKTPEYVYAVTKAYRALLDEHRGIYKKEKQILSAVFSRGGFSDGYLSGKKENMFGIRSESDKLKTKETEITAMPMPDLGVNIFGSFTKDCAFVTGEREGVSYTAYGEAFPATGKGLTKDEAEARLKKVGGTGFFAESCTAHTEDGVFMPVSALNALRRNALEGLKAELLFQNAPKSKLLPFAPQKGNFEYLPVSGDIYKIYGGYFSLPESAARTDVPLWKKELLHKYPADKISLMLPRVITTAEEDEVREIIKNARKMGINKVTVSNLGHLKLCGGMAVYGDFTLNVTNTRTAETLEAFGFSGICISPEVTPRGVKTALGEYIVYGHQPIMHTENCIIKNIRGCNKQCSAVLKDRTGAAFAVTGEYNHRNLIFNSVPTYLMDKDISHNRVFIITDEKELPDPAPKNFTRAYYK